jgi:hypothetical protein
MTDIKSLLEKTQSSGNWQNIAQAWASQNNKNSKHLLGLLVGQTLFGAKEFAMQNKVLKNLKENEKQKTFQLAGMDAKYKAYTELLDNDEAFRKNPSFFLLKGEEKFKELNPDYDTRYNTAQNSQARDNRDLQIQEYATALKTQHEERMKTGNFDTDKARMTKEEFYKPFNDYYESEAERISSPSELSLIHRGWNKVIRRKKSEELTPQQIQENIAIANRSALDFLVDPVKFSGEAAIPVYRKKDEFEFNKNDALAYVHAELRNSPSAPSVLRSLNNNSQESYTIADLNNMVIAGKIDYNKFEEESKELGRAFDSTWKRDNQRENIPSPKDDDYELYYMERADFIDAKQGIGTEKERELRRNIFGLARIDKDIAASGMNPKDHPLNEQKVAYENAIKMSQIDVVGFEMWKLANAQLNHPLDGQLIKDSIRNHPESRLDPEDDDYEEKIKFDSTTDYYLKTISASMDGLNKYFFPKD